MKEEKELSSCRKDYIHDKLSFEDSKGIRRRRKWQPTPVFLPGESQGRRSLLGAVYGVTQSQTRLTWLSSSSSLSIYYIVNHLPVYCPAFPPMLDSQRNERQSLAVVISVTDSALLQLFIEWTKLNWSIIHMPLRNSGNSTDQSTIFVSVQKTLHSPNWCWFPKDRSLILKVNKNTDC